MCPVITYLAWIYRTVPLRGKGCTNWAASTDLRKFNFTAIAILRPSTLLRNEYLNLYGMDVTPQSTLVEPILDGHAIIRGGSGFENGILGQPLNWERIRCQLVEAALLWNRDENKLQGLEYWSFFAFHSLYVCREYVPSFIQSSVIM